MDDVVGSSSSITNAGNSCKPASASAVPGVFCYYTAQDVPNYIDNPQMTTGWSNALWNPQTFSGSPLQVAAANPSAISTIVVDARARRAAGASPSKFLVSGHDDHQGDVMSIRHAHPARSATDERGFAIIIAVALMALVTIVSLGLMTLASSESSHSRRDQAADNSYQAAEAGTDAYLSDLTEATGTAFYDRVPGEGRGDALRTRATPRTRTTAATLVAGRADAAPTSRLVVGQHVDVQDVARFGHRLVHACPDGYQYLIQVYPPNTSLSGLAQVITRIDVTGRPCSFNTAKTSCTGSTDISTWKTIETQLRPSSLADFQAFTATNLTYASGATTTGPIFVGERLQRSHRRTCPTPARRRRTSTQRAPSRSPVDAAERRAEVRPAHEPDCALQAEQLRGGAVQLVLRRRSPRCPARRAAAASRSAPRTTPTRPSAARAPRITVDAWKLVFQSNGTVIVYLVQEVLDGWKHSDDLRPHDGTTSQAPVCGHDADATRCRPTARSTRRRTFSSQGVVKGKVTVATAGNVIYAGNT